MPIRTLSYPWDGRPDSLDELQQLYPAVFGGEARRSENELQAGSEYLDARIRHFMVDEGVSLYTYEATYHKPIAFCRLSSPGQKYFNLFIDLNSEPETIQTAKKGLRIGYDAGSSVLYIPSDQSFTYQPTTNTLFRGALLVIADPELMRQTINYTCAAGRFDAGNTLISGSFRIAHELMDYVLCQRSSASVHQLYVKSAVYRIIALFLQDLEPFSQAGEEKIILQDYEQVIRFRNALTDDFSRPCPTVEEAARELAMSETKFKNIFKTVADMPYYQYYQHYRLQKAKELLKKGTSINNVSYSIGYTGPSSFSNAFKERFGMTPSDYVKTLR